MTAFPMLLFFSANKPTKRKSFTQSSQVYESTSRQISGHLSAALPKKWLLTPPGSGNRQDQRVGPYQVLQDDSSSSFLCFLQLLPRLPGFCKKRTKTRVWESAATPKLGRVCGKVFDLDIKMTPLAPNFSGVRIGQRATKKKEWIADKSRHHSAGLFWFHKTFVLKNQWTSKGKLM